jgi:hypothetical protein
MNISTLAKLTLCGLVYICTVKLIDTLYHGLFSPSLVAMTVVGLNILAGLVQISFFIALYRQFVPKGKQALMVAAWMAIIGSAISMLPKLLALSLLLEQESLFLFISYRTQIKAFSPWLAATLMLAFSLLFLLKHKFSQDRSLKYAFASGATGWLIMASVQALVFINYLTAGRLNWLAYLFTANPIFFVTASSLTLLCLSIFYLTFIRR